MEQKFIQTAIDYKKNIAGKFVLVEGAKLKQRVEGEHICVTKKIDGHLQVVFWQNGQVFMLNSSGKQKAETLKCLDAFAEAMKAAGVKSATIAAELYLPREEGRPRCGDVATALADDAKRDELCLAPFDIIELDGNPWKAEHYNETHNKLCSLFKSQTSNLPRTDAQRIESRRGTGDLRRMGCWRRSRRLGRAFRIVDGMESKASSYNRCCRYWLYDCRQGYSRLDVCRSS